VPTPRPGGHMRPICTLAGATTIVAASTIPAHAFCGFYVAGSNQKMFNDATQVVLMRDGTRTVLAMQNDYRGPLEDFAMVVPGPVVLKPTDVKVVDKGVFAPVDALGSPRRVEYGEQDACRPEYEMGGVEGGVGGGGGPVPAAQPPREMMAKRPMHVSPAPPPAPRPRPAVPPILASFAASPQTVT